VAGKQHAAKTTRLGVVAFTEAPPLPGELALEKYIIMQTPAEGAVWPEKC
jgi:hypothetical protein